MIINNVQLPAEYRPDCSMRLRPMLAVMGDLNGKTLLDIGCSNGFFSQGFLLSGGKEAVGIEPNPQLRKEAHSFDNKSNFLALESFSELKQRKFDFALYLDIHYSLPEKEETAYLKFLSENVAVSFISPSGDGADNNQRLRKDLVEIFQKVEMVIDTPYANRMIYRCEAKVKAALVPPATGASSKK